MSIFTYDRVREFFKQAELIVKRVEAQKNLEKRLRSIDAACVQNKQLLQDANSRAEIDQQKIAINSENRRLASLEKDQVKFMRKWMADFSIWLEKLKSVKNVEPDMLAGMRAAIVCLEEIDIFSDLKDIEYLRLLDTGLEELVNAGIDSGWLDCDPFDKDVKEIKTVRSLFKQITESVFELEKQIQRMDPDLNDEIYLDPTKTHNELLSILEEFKKKIDALFLKVPKHMFEGDDGINDLLMDLLRLNLSKEIELDLAGVTKVFSRNSDYWDLLNHKAESLEARVARLSLDFEKEKYFIEDAHRLIKKEDFLQAQEIRDGLSGRFPSLETSKLDAGILKLRNRAESIVGEYKTFLNENNSKWMDSNGGDEKKIDYDKYSKKSASRVINPFQISAIKQRWYNQIDDFRDELDEVESSFQAMVNNDLKKQGLVSCAFVTKEISQLEEAIQSAFYGRSVKMLVQAFSFVLVLFSVAFFTIYKLLIPHTGFIIDGNGTLYNSVNLLYKDGVVVEDDDFNSVVEGSKISLRGLYPFDYVLRFNKKGEYPTYLEVDSKIGKLINITDRLLDKVQSTPSSELSFQLPPSVKILMEDQHGRKFDLEADTNQLESVSSVQDVIFSSDGNLMIISYLNGSIRVFDVNRKIVLREFREHKDSVESLAIDSSSRYLLSGSVRGTLKLWDLKNDILVQSFSEHGGSIHSIAFKPGELIAATGCADGIIRVYDLNLGKITRELVRTSSDDLAAIGWSVVPRYTNEENSLDVLKMISSQENQRFKQGNNVYTLKFTADGTRLISGCADGSMNIWNLYVDSFYSEKLLELEAELVGIQKKKQAAERRVIAEVKAYEVLEEDVLDMVSVLKQKVKTDDLIKDQNGMDLELELIQQIEELKKKITRLQRNVHITAHQSSINSLSISDNGRYIVTAGSDGIVKIWDYNQRELLGALMGHKNSILSTDIKKNLVLSASSDGVLILWDLEKGSILDKTQAHTTRINSIVFNPARDFYVTGSIDAFVKIWSLQDEIKLKIPGGEYTILFEKDGYASYSEKIEIKRNQDLLLSPKLTLQ